MEEEEEGQVDQCSGRQQHNTTKEWGRNGREVLTAAEEGERHFLALLRAPLSLSLSPFFPSLLSPGLSWTCSARAVLPVLQVGPLGMPTSSLSLSLSVCLRT